MMPLLMAMTVVSLVVWIVRPDELIKPGPFGPARLGIFLLMTFFLGASVQLAVMNA